MSAPQNHANHPKYFPLYHFVAFPILTINLGVAVAGIVKAPSLATTWQLVMAFGFLCVLLAARLMALKVQDRVIRLEERLRLARVLPADLRGALETLRPSHLVALRFAPDDEVVELVRQVVAGKLNEQKEIKQAIRNWRPDYLRA
ncbi:MAG: DUF6526 family protein [Gemmatimonadota bacterium]